MRWFKAAGGLLAILLIVTSCIKVEGTIKVEDDGSGTVDFLTALDTEALTSVLGDFEIPESELGDSDELCAGFEEEFGDTSDLPPGANVTPYREDGFCGTRIQYPLTASLDQSAQVEDLFEEGTRLYKEGDNWFFETDFNADEITSEADGAPPAMLDALFGGASFKITVDLPGKAIAGENNATQVGDDGEFIWDIDLLNPPARLFAQTEPGSGGGTGGDGGGLNPLLIALPVVAIGAGLAFFLMKKRKDEEAAAGGVAPADLTNPLTTTDSAPGQMPLADGPAVAVTPSAFAGSDAAKETVVMNPAEAQRLVEDATAAPAEATAASTEATSAAEPTSAPEPVYDEALGAWVVNDPTRGLLRHDPATDTWNPA